MRLTHRELADKELKKPFPYAPRMSDLAAYEFRIFGFPLLIFYKRGLLKADIEAYENVDYAYGLLGVKIVEHFQSRGSFGSGNPRWPRRAAGYVPVPRSREVGSRRIWRCSRTILATESTRGKTSIIIYGLKAYIESSDLIQRERDRLVAFRKRPASGGGHRAIYQR